MSDLPTMPPPVREPRPPGEALEPTKRPRWPTATGVISVVLAGLGLVCTPIGLAMKNLTSKLAPGTPTVNIEDYLPDWYGTYQTVAILVGIALSVVLLIAGISALRKRAAARTLHLAWAGISIVVSVIHNVILLAFIDLSSAPPEMRFAMVPGIIIGIPVGLAYPVFLLIWFNRAKIKQQISAW